MSKIDNWYQVTSGSKLEQGDILSSCPVVVPSLNLTLPDNITDSGNLKVSVANFPVIVLTQTCDLANEKVDWVMLCPLSFAKEIGKDKQKEIAKGSRPRLAMLEQSDLLDSVFERRIIDFSRVFCMPKDFVAMVAGKQGARLRLQSPWREHISQAFGNFFTRVAIPNPIEF